MTQDGIFRVLNMRIDDIDKEVEYLYQVNPMSPFPGSDETTNQYANGVLRQMVPINVSPDKKQ